MRTASPFALVFVLALTAFAPAIGASPEVWRRSYALEARGDARGALAALETLPDDARGTYLYALRRAWLLYSLGRHDDAVTAYRQAETAAPEAVEPRVGELLPLLALRRWQEAAQRAQAVLHTDPGNYLATRRMALALYHLGRFDDAAHAYQQVFARYPGDLEMLTGAGWCALQRGHRDEAATAFRSVLAVSPDDASATAGLAAAAAH